MIDLRMMRMRMRMRMRMMIIIDYPQSGFSIDGFVQF